MEGSGFLSLLSFQLAIYMALAWWMQTLLWWKPRSGRQSLPSTSAWEAWTGCPSECCEVEGLSWGTWPLGRSFGGARSCDAKAQLLSQHLEREIRSRGGQGKPMCRRGVVHGFYSQSNLHCRPKVCLLTQKCPPRVCAYGSAWGRSCGGSPGPALMVGDLFLPFPCFCFPGG